MMQDVDVDAVVILTESGNHEKHTLELVKYGKHIIVEKPMALTLDGADSQIKAADKTQDKLFIIKQNRFNFAFKNLGLRLNKDDLVN